MQRIREPIKNLAGFAQSEHSSRCYTLADIRSGKENKSATKTRILKRNCPVSSLCFNENSNRAEKCRKWVRRSPPDNFLRKDRESPAPRGSILSFFTSRRSQCLGCYWKRQNICNRDILARSANPSVTLGRSAFLLPYIWKNPVRFMRAF